MYTMQRTAGLALALCLAVSTSTVAQSPTPVPGPTSSPVADAPPSAWAPLIQPGKHPKAREDHTFTADLEGRAAYLFGGRTLDGAALGDLWRFDLDADTWQRLEPEGPSPDARFGHTATWVPGIGLVVWSGQRKQAFYDDLWRFDPSTNTWQRLQADGPVPRARYGSCAALGPDGRLWVSHGFTDDLGRFDDTWAFDFQRGRWTDETPSGSIPGRRCLHDCTFTPDGRFLLYAGQTTGVPALGDLWTRPIDGGWVKGPRPEPAARQLYGLAVMGADAFVFGGADLNGDPLRDLWRLDLGALTWHEVALTGQRPKARSGAAMIADEQRSRIILFGGRSKSTAFDDLWVLSGVQATPQATPGSSPQASPQVSPEPSPSDLTEAG